MVAQQSQRTDATEVDSRHNAWDFPEELQGNSIDPLGSGYLKPISELSEGDGAGALAGGGMLVDSRRWPLSYNLENTFWLFYSLKMHSSSHIRL